MFSSQNKQSQTILLPSPCAGNLLFLLSHLAVTKKRESLLWQKIKRLNLSGLKFACHALGKQHFDWVKSGELWQLRGNFRERCLQLFMPVPLNFPVLFTFVGNHKGKHFMGNFVKLLTVKFSIYSQKFSWWNQFHVNIAKHFRLHKRHENFMQTNPTVLS